ncbi:MAG: restriction endonuclease subunit S [Alphaproteobacteria bacterium]|nr:restriction endonuclease subunit S [Alphaproteobacteria bacterium]
MDNQFSTHQLGEVADIIAGGDKPKIFSLQRTSSVHVPVIANAEKNNGLLGYTDTPRIVDPAVTLAARGSNVGFVAIRKEPFFPVVRVLSLIPNREHLDVDYLFYDLKQNRKKGTGSGQPQITIPDISSKTISLPPISVQKKVAKVLVTLDRKIELNNRINAELEAMAKALYDYWFVQFDFPDENGKPYKSSGGKMVYNETLKREIPEGWENKAVSDLLPVKTGKEDANFSTEKGSYAFFTCGEETLKCDEYIFEGKAILLAGNGSFAIKKFHGKFNAYQRTYVLIPDNEKFYAPVFYAVKDTIKKLTSGSRGSIVKFITKGDIEEIGMALPASGEDNLFSTLNNIFEKISINDTENAKLAELRDWLLPMLMNGQVKVE